VEIELDNLVQEFKPKICSLAYTMPGGNPIVCQMGFATYGNKIILHTNTWTQKWKTIQDGQKIALCIGFNHLHNYIQLQGIAKKIFISDNNFVELESIYFKEHTDAVYYKSNNQEGIFLITPFKLRYARVHEQNVEFDDYSAS